MNQFIWKGLHFAKDRFYKLHKFYNVVYIFSDIILTYTTET